MIYRFLVLGGRRPTFKARPGKKFLVPMGLVGGALDSIGGGGWGPVGTTTLLSSGPPRAPQGRRLDRHLRVRGRRRRLARLPPRARLARASSGPTRSPCSPVASIAAPIAAWLVKHLAGPRARCRGRWPDRAHQLQDHRRGAGRHRLDRRRHRRSSSPSLWITGIVWAVAPGAPRRVEDRRQLEDAAGPGLESARAPSSRGPAGAPRRAAFHFGGGDRVRLVE